MGLISRVSSRTYRETNKKFKKIIMSQGSLLKYDNPVLVSRNDEKKSPASKKFAAKDDIQKSKMTESQKQTDEILNSILPPQQWEADGGLWVQRVSSQPATRSDVIQGPEGTSTLTLL